jgi:hypothetical protein
LLANIQPARKITLAPHETHATSLAQTQLGGNLSSIDLGALKDIQDRKIRADQGASRGPFVSRNAVRFSFSS